MNLKSYSVIITYCCERRKELLSLISSILNQTLPAAEIFIISDGPAKELKNFKYNKVKIIENKISGKPATHRNLGLKLVNNNFVFISDDDDIWHPKKAEIQINQIIENKASICFTKKKNFLFEKEIEFPQINLRNIISKSISSKNLLLSNKLPLSSVLLNTHLIDINFDENEFFKAWEDYELWLRKSKSHKIIQINKKLLYYRQNPKSIRKGITLRNLKNQKKYLLQNHSKSFSDKILISFIFAARIILAWLRP